MPSMPHVWQMEMLLARTPPHVTCTHHEYDAKGTTISSDDMISKSFFFRPTELSILRNYIPTHLQSCSTYELLQPDSEEQMRLMLAINAHVKFMPRLPNRYYGNCFAYPIVLSTARDLLLI
ncbi:hypothetical protein L6452_29365 [Arctium lappa]|uniref:Uncharacterized protein n=1 Tax=Arctium lappa TaxID=4217 RepID=A0ACB8ZKY9_ARCLA|nr:hypothetical protein L6452_29365 [Arctium lappa]